MTCLDNTTANVVIVLQSYGNNTAQSMIDSVVNYMLGLDHPAVFYLQSGWVVCLNMDCEWKLDNITMVDSPTTTTDESDNDKSIPLVVGFAIGLLLVVAIASLLCIIVICRKKSRLVQKLD